MTTFNVNLAREMIQQNLRIPASLPGPHPLSLKKEQLFRTQVYYTCPESEWVKDLNAYIDVFNQSVCYDGVIYCPQGAYFRHSGLTNAFRDLMLNEKGLKQGDTFVWEESDSTDVLVFYTWHV
jgi:hypothetical protein